MRGTVEDIIDRRQRALGRKRLPRWYHYVDWPWIGFCICMLVLAAALIVEWVAKRGML